MDTRSEIVSMVVLHAAATLWGEGRAQTMEITIPPTVATSTAAAHLYAAVLQRMPFTLDSLREKADNCVVLLNTDSAQSCLKLGLAF